MTFNYGSHKFNFAAGATLGLHYDKIIEEGNHLPVPVICGEHRLGKTKSARAALHLMGNGRQFFSSARERFIPHLCSRSTFPPVLDDIKNTRQLGELALAYFDGGKDGTCSRKWWACTNWWACTRLQVCQWERFFSLIQPKKPSIAWSQHNLKLSIAFILIS